MRTLKNIVLHQQILYYQTCMVPMITSKKKIACSGCLNKKIYDAKLNNSKYVEIWVPESPLGNGFM